MQERQHCELMVSGGHVLTMEAAAPTFDDGAVAIAGGRIVAVGARGDIEARFTADETIDAGGCAVLPGLVDAYAHAGHGMIRGLFHPEAGWPAYPLYWHHAEPEWWRAEADLAALERLMAGVTTGLSVIGATPARADDTVFSDMNAQAYLAAGLSLIIGIGPPDPVFPHLPQPMVGSFPQDGAWVSRGFTEADALRVSRDVIRRWHGAGDGRIGVALAPPYLFGRHVAHRRQPHRLPDASDAPSMLAHARLMREVADDHGVIIQTHVFGGSVAFAQRHFGAAEVARLLSGPVVAAHANGLAPEEIDVLGAHGCGIATVAFTHENLWYGMAPIPALVRAGCKVAITTDGAAPYASLDPWRELSRAAWNQWIAADTQSVMPPETLLRMVTIDAARALALDHRIGSLAPGKDADLIVMDLGAPHLGAVHDLPSSLAIYATASDVRDVIAKGSLLLRRRRPLRVDAPSILAAARDHGRRAVARVDLRPYARGATPWCGGAEWPKP
jgi:cytosine/adenosine deaminase-related metal-dependent hydrolase